MEEYICVGVFTKMIQVTAEDERDAYTKGERDLHVNRAIKAGLNFSNWHVIKVTPVQPQLPPDEPRGVPKAQPRGGSVNYPGVWQDIPEF